MITPEIYGPEVCRLRTHLWIHNHFLDPQTDADLYFYKICECGLTRILLINVFSIYTDILESI